MPGKVRVDDRRLNQFMKGIDAAQKTRIKVGVLGSMAAEAHPSGLTNAYIASIHELGAGVPQRSWLRGWVSPNEPFIRKRLMSAFQRCAHGASPSKEFGLIGKWADGEIKVRISSGVRARPPSGVDRIQGKTPLIDTGQFRTSITSEVYRARR